MYHIQIHGRLHQSLPEKNDHLLKELRDEGRQESLIATLDIWELQLIQYGNEIIERRKKWKGRKKTKGKKKIVNFIKKKKRSHLRLYEIVASACSKYLY